MSKNLLFWSARARPRFGKVRRVAPGGKRRHAAALQTGGYTRGNDLSGTLEGAGGIGGLLERADGYNSSSGTWTNHNFYHADGNGNITYLVNSSQTLAASYRYDAFGNTLASSGTYASANTYRFSSKEFIPNAGLYYYLYRFYDPALQRWINRDPLGEAVVGNAYWYSENSPVFLVDPLGLSPWSMPTWMDPSGGVHYDTPPSQQPSPQPSNGFQTYIPLDWQNCANKLSIKQLTISNNHVFIKWPSQIDGSGRDPSPGPVIPLPAIPSPPSFPTNNPPVVPTNNPPNNPTNGPH